MVDIEHRYLKSKFHSKQFWIACYLMDFLEEEHPATVRQCFYRAVIAGLIENNKSQYEKIIRILKSLRMNGDLPLDWIIDSGRRREQIPCWTDLRHYLKNVRNGYCLDFWEHLPDHVCLLVEKDTVYGTIQETCDYLKIPCWVSKGYHSISLCNQISKEWKQMDCPIYLYYIGDFDPSGLDIEDCYRKLIEQFLDNSADVTWERLAITRDDMGAPDVFKVPLKMSDTRTPGYIKEYELDYGTEVEALAPSVLRQRVSEKVQEHFTKSQWRQLEGKEARQRISLSKFIDDYSSNKYRP